MTPCFRSFILFQLWSHSFQIFHRGCLCLHYLLRPNPMHWWRSTRHYTATCNLYSRWLWWTLDSSIYKTSILIPEGCRTRTISRMQLQTILYGLKRVRRTASCMRDCWKRRGRRSEGASWILMGSERWRNILNEVKIWRIEQDAPGF